MNTTILSPSPTKEAPVLLDKSFSAAISESYGTIDIRVVVLQKRPQQSQAEPETPLDAEQGEIFLSDTGKSPLAGYLEDPKRGKECIVFLVNGQRQEAWDNTFIQRDLGFKYLRNRTMIIATLDGLKPEALADIMQGSREHFYPGVVYGAIVGRLTATLRKDPDLEELEAEAERQISELRSGDTAVKNALDQLIEDHHAHGDHPYEGIGESGPVTSTGGGFGEINSQNVVVDPSVATGAPTEGPYLLSDHASPKIRLIPDEEVSIKVQTNPLEAFAEVAAIHVSALPETKGLKIGQDRSDHRLTIKLEFNEPEDFDEDAYPIDATLRVVGRLNGLAEPRLLEKKIVIARPKVRPKRPPVELKEQPTFLKVISRQPVRLVRGAADTHVRFKWDGQDALASGSPPTWIFRPTCRTQPSLSPMTFSRPRNGRFELLVPTPADLSTGALLDFDVEAVGPAGNKLATTFTGEVVEPPPPPLPRKMKANIPEAAAQRRPPYKLVYINQDRFDEVPLWDDRTWTVNDAGCFHEPTASQPLVLVINEDFFLLEQFRKDITGGVKKLDAATVERRVTRYTSHVAFHLYQMYVNYRSQQEAAKRDPELREPTAEQMNGEIHRVAATLTKMMQVAS
jgi:hypothetical protein